MCHNHGHVTFVSTNFGLFFFQQSNFYIFLLNTCSFPLFENYESVSGKGRKALVILHGNGGLYEREREEIMSLKVLYPGLPSSQQFYDFVK